MKLDRRINPKFRVVENIEIPYPEKISLDNGIETHIIQSDNQDIIKLEVIFNAGSWFQNKPLVGTFTSEMLLEGTKLLSSKKIAEKLDFYGAFIHPQPTKDHSNITLYTLSKYLPETIQLLSDIIINPIYPEKELSIALAKRKQHFQVELEKVNNVSRREFNYQLFGEKHPYGYKVKLSDYDNLSQSDLIDFHNKNYNPLNCKILISGNIKDHEIELLNKFIGTKNWKPGLKNEFESVAPNPINQKRYEINKQDAKQSAIRLGKLVINKDHEDYLKLNVVNTILGGYFGSRLMKKIREEKGYTYGINSALISLKNACFFIILSELRSDATNDAINDISAEIKKLRTEEISIKELETVKNYMLGHLLRSFDGIFEISSNIRNLIDLNLDFDFYNKSIDTIKNITKFDILDISNKYLHEDSLYQTIVGNIQE